MKRLAPALALSVVIFLTVAIQAQNAAESTAVRATVTNYIEAYWTGDARRMEQTLHPHYLKHMIHGDIPVREKTGQDMVKEVAKNGPIDAPATSKTEQVEVLDVAGTIASAKLITPGWTD
jgi:hypothetical protein